MHAQPFARLMESLGPFEDAPHIAVATSGGRDSMALCLLMHAWVKARAGRITALGVNHGLRPETRTEMRLTAARLRRACIPFITLTWQHRDTPPDRAIQATARTARYALMEEWCRTHGVLHLATAHHAEDQMETRMMRARHGSGPTGLAGMSAVHEHHGVRIIRPLLCTPRQHLEDFLRQRSMDWIEDPSNNNPAFERVRIRRELMTVSTAQRAVLIKNHPSPHTRQGQERAVLSLLAKTLCVHRTGWAHLTSLNEAFFGIRTSRHKEACAEALQRVICAVGGQAWPPSLNKCHTIVDAMRQGAGTRHPRRRTLGRCLLSFTKETCTITREDRHLPAPMPIPPSLTVEKWDGRFHIILPPAARGGDIIPFTQVSTGTVDAVSCLDQDAFHALPATARMGLPVVRYPSGQCVLPPFASSPKHLQGFTNTEASQPKMRFHPTRAIFFTPFVLSSA